MTYDHNKLNNSLDKIEKIMGMTEKKMSFDSVNVECDHDYAVI